jgi:selenide, water dikinase
MPHGALSGPDPGPDPSTRVLTSFAHGAGCGCKLPAADLHALLAGLPAPVDDRVLVGFHGADDAAVVQLTPDLALVQTVDFFTPVVDDPRDFGAIAAANALSDVYAMGGRPVSALSIVGFPLAQLGGGVLRAIIDGALEVVSTAGASLVGGHSIEDPEPKFGLAVTGLVDPARMLRNAGARPGEVLVLTKPLGTGALVTGAQRGAADPAQLAAAVVVMRALNDVAGRQAVDAVASAATDVTGFGLLGHAHGIARESGVALELEAGAVPVIAGARELLEGGQGISGGTRRNAERAAAFARFHEAVPAWRRWLLSDATTSGGLLVAVAPERAAQVTGAVVGRVTDGPAGTIAVR